MCTVCESTREETAPKAEASPPPWYVRPSLRTPQAWYAERHGSGLAVLFHGRGAEEEARAFAAWRNAGSAPAAVAGLKVVLDALARAHFCVGDAAGEVRQMLLDAGHPTPNPIEAKERTR